MDPLEEPIMDIAAGGQEMSNQPQGFTGVWIATINGRVCSFSKIQMCIWVLYILFIGSFVKVVNYFMFLYSMTDVSHIAVY